MGGSLGVVDGSPGVVDGSPLVEIVGYDLVAARAVVAEGLWGRRPVSLQAQCTAHRMYCSQKSSLNTGRLPYFLAKLVSKERDCHSFFLLERKRPRAIRIPCRTQ